MSTESTFYEDDNEDLFINEDLNDGSITVYSNYMLDSCAIVTLPEEAIRAMYRYVEQRKETEK